MMKIFMLWILLSVSTFNTPKQTTIPVDKPTLIYVYDPMCGWCYGFSHVFKAFRNKHDQKFDFEIVSGGMVTGKGEGYIGDDLAKYIESAYKRVETASGCKYGDAYLDQLKNRKLWLSSTKPSMALEAFKKYKYNDAIEFAAAVQSAFFVEGKDLRDDKVYEPIVERFGVNKDAFIKILNDPKTKEATENGYMTATNYGVKGFPTMLLLHKGKYYKVMDGFIDLATLEQNISKIIKL
jgi:putative protein-disulfide isomerase